MRETENRIEDVVEENDVVSESVIGAAIEVHKHLGPGLLECVYERALRHELALRGVPFATQQPVPVHYKGHFCGDDLVLDLVVAGRLIVELKAVHQLHPIHEAQLITYLKLTGIRAGLLVNFNVRRLKDGLKRFVV